MGAVGLNMCVTGDVGVNNVVEKDRVEKCKQKKAKRKKRKLYGCMQLMVLNYL